MIYPGLMALRCHQTWLAGKFTEFMGDEFLLNPHFVCGFPVATSFMKPEGILCSRPWVDVRLYSASCPFIMRGCCTSFLLIANHK